MVVEEEEEKQRKKARQEYTNMYIVDENNFIFALWESLVSLFLCLFFLIFFSSLLKHSFLGTRMYTVPRSSLSPFFPPSLSPLLLEGDEML